MRRRKLLIRLTLLILFIFIINTAALKFHWYFSISWFDMLMHFMGGLWIALLGFYIFGSKNSPFIPLFKILSLVLLVGILWEVFEVAVNETIARSSLDTADIFSDLLFDLLGGFAGTYYYYRRIIFKAENKLQ